MLGEGEWKINKYGSDYRQQWLKVYLRIDSTTLESQSVEMSDIATGDAPILQFLLDQITADVRVASANVDGAYETKVCYATKPQSGGILCLERSM